MSKASRSRKMRRSANRKKNATVSVKVRKVEQSASDSQERADTAIGLSDAITMEEKQQEQVEQLDSAKIVFEEQVENICRKVEALNGRVQILNLSNVIPQAVEHTTEGCPDADQIPICEPCSPIAAADIVPEDEYDISPEEFAVIAEAVDEEEQVEQAEVAVESEPQQQEEEALLEPMILNNVDVVSTAASTKGLDIYAVLREEVGQVEIPKVSPWEWTFLAASVMLSLTS